MLNFLKKLFGFKSNEPEKEELNKSNPSYAPEAKEPEVDITDKFTEDAHCEQCDCSEEPVGCVCTTTTDAVYVGTSDDQDDVVLSEAALHKYEDITDDEQCEDTNEEACDTACEESIDSENCLDTNDESCNDDTDKYLTNEISCGIDDFLAGFKGSMSVSDDIRAYQLLKDGKTLKEISEIYSVAATTIKRRQDSLSDKLTRICGYIADTYGNTSQEICEILREYFGVDFICNPSDEDKASHPECIALYVK